MHSTSHYSTYCLMLQSSLAIAWLQFPTVEVPLLSLTLLQAGYHLTTCPQPSTLSLWLTQNHVTTDSQSWRQDPSWGQDQNFVTVRWLLSQMRGRVCYLPWSLSVVHVIYIQFYMLAFYTVSQLSESPVPCRYILFTVLHATLICMYNTYKTSVSLGFLTC
jgi:hypothetical protein